MKRFIALVMCMFFMVFAIKASAASHFVKDKVGNTEIKVTVNHAVVIEKAEKSNSVIAQFKRLCDPGGLPALIKLPVNKTEYAVAVNARKYDNRLYSYWRNWQEQNLKDKNIT